MSIGRSRASRRLAVVAISGFALAGMAVLAAARTITTPGRSSAAAGQTQLTTTVNDFFQPGTQPTDMIESMFTSANCVACHGGYPDDDNPVHDVRPYDSWVTSMMAQAARDPVWHGALAVANSDAAVSGEFCIRCHAPVAWLGGRSTPGDTSNFIPDDFDGVTCHHCHRMVDPIADLANPTEDTMILADLVTNMTYPDDPGNARYIVDPLDTRRGPLTDVPLNIHPVDILVSPFHNESLLCGACHDVSNPVYTRQMDGSYALNANDSQHPTQDPQEMMPEQRTYSEWLNSDFADGGVVFADNRFGGSHPTGLMESCQDCHMPQQSGGICGFWTSPPFFSRTYVHQHTFTGANTWVLGAVRDEYGDSETGLTAAMVTEAELRTTAMLQAASDMQLSQVGDMLKVRVVNMSGHKLPTGYPEGRRMWVNVRFYDMGAALVAEHGHYDFGTADLTTGDTTVYEAVLGLDATAAAATGLPVGASGHLALNNEVLKDNRIPPMGFTNAAFDAIRAAPVAAVYDDGQYWDDSEFPIPATAVEAVVTLYYQTSSKEYMEFLRDSIGGANTAGINAHTRWVANGMSAPVDMDSGILALIVSPSAADANTDGVVDISDLLLVLADWGPCPPPDLCPSDVNCDGVIDVADMLLVLADWS